MQEKKIRTFIRVILALFIIGFAYSLSFTFVVNKKENDIRKKYTGIPDSSATIKKELDDLYNSDNALEVGVWTNFWLDGYTYKQAKQNALNLGLDLKGGMSALLEVSQRDIIEGLVRTTGPHINNPHFKDILDELGETGADSYIEDFFGLIDEKNKSLITQNIDTLDVLDMFTSAGNGEFKERDKLIEWLELKSEDLYNLTFESLKRRLDQFGLVNPNIQKIEKDKKILIELPGMTNNEVVEDYLSATGSLEFWKGVRIQDLHKTNPDVFTDSLFLSIANLPPSSAQYTTIDSLGATVTKKYPSSSLEEGDAPDLFAYNNPAIANIYIGKGSNIYIGKGEKEGKFDARKYFDQLSEDLNNSYVFYFTESSQEPSGSVNKDYIQVVALTGKENNPTQPLLTGESIQSAAQEFGEFMTPSIGMKMTTAGASEWSRITGEMQPEKNSNGIITKPGDHVAIVLDKEVYSYPVVQGQLSTSSQITGSFTVREAKNIASILNSGKLDAEVIFRSSEYVGPSLGKESVQKGLTSFLVALLFILLYMIFYYAHAGVASNLALIINMFFIFGALAAFNATLTLPGIAGIVLTIGMAVDANVLIYERIKEELSQDKGLSLAVRDGYKNAYSAIIDANVTTLLTAVILFYFGTGPIKGFATTLMIGIMTSLFCAIFITRLVFESRLAKKKNIFFSNRLTKNLFRNTKISFIGRRKWAYVFSFLFICVGAVSLFTNKLDLGVDLQGGRSYVVEFNALGDKELSTSDIREVFGNLFVTEDGVKKYPVVKKSGDFGVDNRVKITTSFLGQDGKGNDVRELIKEGVISYQGIKNIADERKEDSDYSAYFNIVSEEEVGPTIADDLRKSAFLSVFFALIVIFAYIFFRFRKWQYSLGAVVALFHDVLIIISIFSLLYKILPFSLEIDQAFIAAILTVIGYSLNDTVVVFDRVREFQGTKVGDPKMIVNKALNSTLSRTVNTSLTTIVVLLIIFTFGGEVIRGFMFALILGVIVGTYSSLFIATPIMVDTSKMKKLT